jgi:beta-phosphoglucomutase
LRSKSPPPAAAVVFDFDGVLADTEAMHLSAFQQVFAARGWPLDAREYFDEYLGYDDRALVRLYGARHDHRIAASDVETLVARKADVFQQLVTGGHVLYPQARDAVRRLGEAFPLAVATGSFREEVVAILTAVGLIDAFAAVVAADDVRRPKPAPDTYAVAVARIGVEPARAVAIEDSAGGLSAARAAGLRTIGLTTTSPETRLRPHADLVLASLEDVTADRIVELIGR